jgi:hypothetical protein
MSNEENFDQNRDTTQPKWTPSPSRGRKRNFILISAAALLILSVSAFVAYFKYDVWKSPKNLYLESEFVNFLSLSEGVQDSLELVADTLSNNIRTEDELSVNVNSTKSLGEFGDVIVGFLNSTTFNTDTAYNEKDKKLSSKLGIKTDGEQWLNLELFSENDILAFSASSIAPNKYLKLDLKNKKLEETLSLQDTIPKRIVNSDEWMKALKIENDELKPIVSNMLDSYINNISDEQVVLERDIAYKLAGETIKTRKLSLTFTPKQFDKMMNDMYKNVVLNQSFQDLLYSKYDNIVKLIEDSGIPVEDKVSKEEMIRAMEDLYKELKSESDSVQREDIHMTLFIDADKNIVSRQIHLADKETEFVLGIDNYKKDSLDMTKIDINAKDLISKQGLIFMLENSTKGNDEKSKQDLTIKVSVDESSDNNTTISWESSLDKATKDDQLNQILEYALKLDSAETGNLNLTGTWSEDSKTVSDGKTYAYKMVLDFEQSDLSLLGELPISDVTFRLKGKQTNPDAIQIPKWTSENSLDVAAATEEELSAASEAYMMQVFEFYVKNQKRLSFLESLLP